MSTEELTAEQYEKTVTDSLNKIKHMAEHDPVLMPLLETLFMAAQKDDNDTTLAMTLAIIGELYTEIRDLRKAHDTIANMMADKI